MNAGYDPRAYEATPQQMASIWERLSNGAGGAWDAMKKFAMSTSMGVPSESRQSGVAEGAVFSGDNPSPNQPAGPMYAVAMPYDFPKYGPASVPLRPMDKIQALNQKPDVFAKPAPSKARGIPTKGMPSANPGSDPDYLSLLSQIRDSGSAMAGEQRAAADGLNPSLQNMTQGNLQYDLTPLLSLIDQRTGSNMANSYKVPESGKERISDVMQLKNNLAQMGIQASETELKALKDYAQGVFGLKKFQADQDYRNKSLDVQKEQNAVGRAKIEAIGGKSPEGIKALDRAFAKDYNSYVLQGGASAAKVQLASLNKNLERMLATKDFSGPAIGAMPEGVRSKMAPDSFAIQEAVHEAATQSLKAILGSQFTEKEGMQIKNYSFNPSLSPEENIYRVNKLIRKLEGMAQAKDAANRYFEQNGTMSGFHGDIPSVADITDLFSEKNREVGSKNLEDMSEAELDAELARLQGGG